MTPVSKRALRTLTSTRMSSPSKRIRRVGVDECDFQRQPSICGQRMLRKSEIALVDMNVSCSALEKVLLLYASGDSDSSMQISIITGMQRHMDQWTDLCSYAPSQLVPPKHTDKLSSGTTSNQKEKAVGWVDMVALLDSDLSRPASDTGG